MEHIRYPVLNAVIDTSSPFARAFALVFAYLLLWTCPGYADSAVQLRLDGDRLWLSAQDAPIADVLESFVRAGVRVRADPELTGRITGSVQDRNVEQALDSVLESMGYALIWEVLNGPLGPYPKLSQLHVFKPGRQEHIRNFGPAEKNLRVARWPDGIGPLYVPDEILLGFSPEASLEDLKRLLAQIGGTVVDGIPELGIYRIRLPLGANIPDLVQQIGRNPLVAVAEPNYVYEGPEPSPRATRIDGFSPSALHRPALVEDAGPVAILDSGLAAGPEIESLIVGRLDALDPERALTDTLGHGTQMALIAAGAVSPFGIPAPGAVEGVPIVAVRTFDDNGAASNFHILRSLMYASDQGARVVNLSWGAETGSRFLSDALNVVRSRGMVVVAAAGNQGVDRPMYPAAYPGVIGVGAIGEDGAPWAFSNQGSHIFLAAPGVAQFPVGHQGPPGEYAGTSISSAYVARALGLYFTRNPDATLEQAISDLKQAVSEDQGSTWNPQTGHGVLDTNALRVFLGK